MNLLPTLCPVSFTLVADRAVRIFGEMGPQVVLTALRLNKPVDFLHVHQPAVSAQDEIDTPIAVADMGLTNLFDAGL